MVEAAFRLENFQFDKVFMDFEPQSNSKMWSLSVAPQGVYHERDGYFDLLFTLHAVMGEDASAKSPRMEIRCKAVFRFIKPIEFSKIPSYFYSNSIAILFPYVRAFVSTVTLQANIPPVILPTYNLSNLQDELLQHTVVEKA